MQPWVSRDSGVGGVDTVSTPYRCASWRVIAYTPLEGVAELHFEVDALPEPLPDVMTRQTRATPRHQVER